MKNWTWGQKLTMEEEDLVYDLLQRYDPCADEMTSSGPANPLYEDCWEFEAPDGDQKSCRSRDRLQAYVRRHHALPPKDNTTEDEADVLLMVLDLR